MPLPDCNQQCPTAFSFRTGSGVIMDEQFSVSLSQWEKFQFVVDFNQLGVSDILTDEPQPLGQGAGPNPSRLLATAVGNCLSSSLLFCLQKAHVNVRGLKCVVEGEIERNERGRMRIPELRVRIEPTVDEADVERIGRCSQIFEDFCLV